MFLNDIIVTKLFYDDPVKLTRKKKYPNEKHRTMLVGILLFNTHASRWFKQWKTDSVTVILFKKFFYTRIYYKNDCR